MSSVLALWCAGIALAQWQPERPPGALVWAAVLLALVAAAAALAAPLPRRAERHTRRALLLAAGTLAGYALGCHAALARADDQLAAALDGNTVELDAWVADLPQPVHAGVRLLLAGSAEARALGVPARVSVLLPQALAQRQPPSGGECRHVRLRLQPQHGLLNFGGFDAEAWAWSAGIGASGKVLASKPCEHGQAPWWAALERLRDRVRARLQQVLDGRPGAGIVVALAVGDQGGVTPEQWTLLWRSGIGHLVSISGVHVTLLAGVLRQLCERGWRCSARACRWLPASRPAQLASLVAALGYALLAGFSVPTRRTLFMLAATALCERLGCRPAAGRVFWMAAAATLGSDPFAALSPSFWLSFGAVGGLILADQGRHQTRAPWRTELEAQWVANLVMLPLIALWFGQLSLVSPLANLVAIPLVGLVVTPLALAAMFPGLHLLALPAAWLLERLLQGLQWLAAPAWAAVDLAAPDPAVLALSLCAVLVLLLGSAHLPGAGWALLALLPLFVPANPVPSGALRIEVADIGQGLAVLVRTHAHLLLFDTGPRWPGGDAGQRTLLPLLRAEGLPAIDRLVLSHPDADHVGGADSLIAAVPVAEVETGFGRPASRDCVAGEHWNWDGVDFAVLHPPAAAGTASGAHDRNNHACVLRVACAGHTVLLPADIEAAAERALLGDPDLAPLLRSEVVVVAHHGSRSSSTPDFIAATGARLALVSLGWRNRYHHPAPEVAERWQQAGAQWLRTDRDGALRVDIDAGGVHVGTARQQRAAWWRP